MTREAPPRWLERALLRVLCGHDRETISGDLLEEYREEQLPRFGLLRADVWYLRQYLSFASVRLWKGSHVNQILALLCLFVAAASLWLAIMENVLKHAGYGGRSLIAACLAAQAIGTLLYLLFSGRTLVRGLVLTAALAVLLFGAMTVISILEAQHFEGYLLLIGVALILQGACTIWVLLRQRTGKAA